MGFGASILVGDANESLDATIAGCLVEVRIEQTLTDPTAFAVRILEDIKDGAPLHAGHEHLQPDQILSVAVDDNGSPRCLVRGPIQETESEYTLGGPGSWLQVSGTDRRVEMDRACWEAAWEGRASDAASAIIAGYGFEPDVDQTELQYSSQQTLNQRSTDLEFLKKIASDNGLNMWISYKISSSIAGVTIDETVRMKASPLATLSQGSSLAPSVDVSLRVHVSNDQCPNVTAFNLRQDVERPTSFDGSALSIDDVIDDPIAATDEQDAVRGGSGLAEVSPIKRTLCVSSAGGSTEVQAKAAAALADAGWFIRVTASTTAHLLRGVLVPHDLVEVQGLGGDQSGTFRVSKVTHVINSTEHMMDLELESNRIGAS